MLDQIYSGNSVKKSQNSDLTDEILRLTVINHTLILELCRQAAQTLKSIFISHVVTTCRLFFNQSWNQTLSARSVLQGSNPNCLSALSVLSHFPISFRRLHLFDQWLIPAPDCCDSTASEGQEGQGDFRLSLCLLPAYVVLASRLWPRCEHLCLSARGISFTETSRCFHVIPAMPEVLWRTTCADSCVPADTGSVMRLWAEAR